MFDIKSKKIPTSSGCYLYKKDKKVIYVGKAKNLKKRVLSYFYKKDYDIKTRALVADIEDVEFFQTNTEVEALLLENNLIKKYKPKYNVMLKDSKGYSYILITNEKFPRLLTARNKKRKGEYFGPFISGNYRKELIHLLKKTYKLRTCRVLPKRACLRFQINLCDAPCINNISKEEYDKKINSIREILKGKDKQVRKSLEKEMQTYSLNQEYEKAMVVKDRIDAINYLSDRQLIENENFINEDLINFMKISDKKVKIVVFELRSGILKDNDEYELDYTENFFDDFVKAYYNIKEKIPNVIYLPTVLHDKEIEKYLSDLKEKKVELKIPKKGVKLGLLKLAKDNIKIMLNKKEIQKLQLKDNLKLDKLPSTIECFDISHTQGSEVVASMVHFKDGNPDKSNYRRFKIKTVVGVDDFRAMAEVVNRR
jgi:excinuclease ABC subunit C